MPGPGFLNSTAALATAWAVNAKVLAMAGQNPVPSIGKGFGLLHEIPDQLAVMAQLTKWSSRIESPAEFFRYARVALQLIARPLRPLKITKASVPVRATRFVAAFADGALAAVNKGANAVVTLDGDGQHSPHDIPLLLSCAKQYPDDIIIGSRLADKKSIPKKRYYANRIANFWISWACGYRIADSQSGFRLYPCLLLDKLTTSLKKSKSFVLESEILIKAAHSGVHSHPVQIPAVYSENARPSHFRGVRDIVNITLMVATELLKRGLYIPGLYRAWIRPLTPASRYDQTGLDGYFTLLLSLLIIALSGGISYIATVIYTFNKARKIPYEMPAAATL